MRNRLNEEQLDRDIAAVLTQVVVDREDPAFENPAKPVGPYYTAYRANLLMQEQGWDMVEEHDRGWRKVVASPKPTKILNSRLLRRLVDDRAIIIAGGGGGIPVYEDVGGYYRGVEAVIDKDYVASILATDLDADLFIVLTNVPMIAENFGRPSQKWLRTLPVHKALEMMESNQFPAGSMGPKVQSAIDFVTATGKEVLITDADSLKQALERKAGTFIVADGEIEYAGIQ
jgi:carbamate kinase